MTPTTGKKSPVPRHARGGHRGRQANGVGMGGVAPNVTLVPVKVCDTSGYCHATSVVNRFTYAGDARLDVIDMTFFVDDDDEFQQSTESKCSSDPVQRSFRRAVERADSYARSRGVTPVAALGNSDQDLAHPVDDSGQPRCFSHGRIDASQAVAHDTSTVSDETAPPCPEYAE